MIKLFPLIFLLLMQGACVQAPLSAKLSKVIDPWATMPTGVSMLAPGIISTRHNERDLAVSPDGRHVMFTRVSPQNRFSAIMQTRLSENGFKQPVIASFSGKYSDLEPVFTPDGKRIYFASNRPLSGQGKPKDFDIWYVEKKNNAWSQAVNVGAPVNSDQDEFYPSLTRNGDLYFTGLFDRAGSGENIYKSAYVNGKYQRPVAINEKPSLNNNEFNAFVSPDEDYLIFSSDRKQQRGDYADLYISFLRDGQWSDAVNLGEQINTSRLDYCPFVLESNGNRLLFFTRTDVEIQDHFPQSLNNAQFREVLDSVENGSGNIYTVNFEHLMKTLELN